MEELETLIKLVGGICARTFTEFPVGAGEKDGGFWREGEALYTATAHPLAGNWPTVTKVLGFLLYMIISVVLFVSSYSGGTSNKILECLGASMIIGGSLLFCYLLSNIGERYTPFLIYGTFISIVLAGIILRQFYF